MAIHKLCPKCRQTFQVSKEYRELCYVCTELRRTKNRDIIMPALKFLTVVVILYFGALVFFP